MRTRREMFALAVFVIAALASLATSQSYAVSKSAEGTVEIGSGGEGHVTGLLDFATSAPAGARFTVSVDSRGLGRGLGSVPLEGQLRLGGEGGNGDWQPLPLTLDTTAGQLCADASPCSIPIDLLLRPTTGEAVDAAIQWRMSATLWDVNDPSSFTLAASSPNVASTVNAAAGIGFALGMALAALVAFAASMFSWRTSPLLEVLATLGLVAAALLILSSPSSDLLVGSLAIVVAVIVAGYGIAAHAFGLRPGHLIAAALVSSPLLLAAFADSGLFNAVHVGIWFAASGFALVAGAVVFYRALDPATRTQAWDRFRGSYGVSLLALALIFTALIWSLAIGANLTQYDLAYVFIPVAGYGLLAWAFWRWLTGRPLLMVVMGIACAPLALIGFVAAGLPYLFFGPVPPLVLPSLLFIFLGGLALAIWALKWHDEMDGARRPTNT